MTSVISKKLGYSVAQQFKEGFYESSPTVGYVYIGNHLVYQDEENPSSITDSIKDEKTVWDNIIAAKKIVGTDVELVVPRIDWTANTKYKQYDDTISVSELITACAAIYNVASITANAGAVGVNSYVTFSDGGTSNTSANARIYVNTAGYIVNVVVIANGAYGYAYGYTYGYEVSAKNVDVVTVLVKVSNGGIEIARTGVLEIV
jgi:hypothetical protein